MQVTLKSWPNLLDHYTRSSVPFLAMVYVAANNIDGVDIDWKSWSGAGGAEVPIAGFKQNSGALCPRIL